MNNQHTPPTTLQIQLTELAALISDAIKQKQEEEQKEVLRQRNDQLEVQIRDLKNQLADEQARRYDNEIHKLKYANKIQKLEDDLSQKKDANQHKDQQAANLLGSIGRQLVRVHRLMCEPISTNKEARNNAKVIISRLMDEIEERVDGHPFPNCLDERESVDDQPPLLSSSTYRNGGA